MERFKCDEIPLIEHDCSLVPVSSYEIEQEYNERGNLEAFQALEIGFVEHDGWYTVE